MGRRPTAPVARVEDDEEGEGEDGALDANVEKDAASTGAFPLAPSAPARHGSSGRNKREQDRRGLGREEGDKSWAPLVCVEEIGGLAKGNFRPYEKYVSLHTPACGLGVVGDV